jgi:hypothetical protein
MGAFMGMQLGALGLAALLVTGVACDEGDVDLGGPLPTPARPARVSASCTWTPVVLTHIDGISRGTLGIDWANLYVVAYADTNPSDETLWRVPLTGDAPQVVAEHQDHIGGIAFDYGASSSPSPVLWSTGSAGGAGAIWKSDPASGTTAIATNRTAPGVLIVLGPRVYWAESAGGGAGEGSIEFAPVAGGDVSMLQQMPGDRIPSAFGSDGAFLYWTTEDPGVDNATTTQLVGVPIPLPFGAPRTIAQGVAAFKVTTEGLVYSGADAVTREVVYDSGETPTVQTVPTSGFVQAIAADDASVYFVDPATRELLQAPVDGGRIQTLTGGVDPASRLQADGKCVYWIDAGAQAIMMVRS